MTDDTIFALASGAGRAGIAVFRLSGPRAGEALTRLSGRGLPPPRRATRVVLTEADEVLDDGLALWFPGPASFTGEDVVELHLHGGRAVTRAMAAALLGLGLRPAEAGEFSRRAFMAGKLDLTRAEAIADLVDAETAAQRRQALRQMDGSLERLVEGWRARLVTAAALVEAAIDFSDEDLPDGIGERVLALVDGLTAEMTAALVNGGRGERLRDGVHIAVIGAPNAGKSSLVNRIAGREAAIVSATAGTTRDVIEVHLDLGGWPVILADTAGLREAAGEVEAEGIRRALARAESADITLAIFDGTLLPERDAATVAAMGPAGLAVVNKIDRACHPVPERMDGAMVVAVSALSGVGIETLLVVLETMVADRFAVGPGAVLTRARHRAAVESCLAALHRFVTRREVELAAEELRLAGRALGRITGRIDVEELLDVVFRDFCIGK